MAIFYVWELKNYKWGPSSIWNMIKVWKFCGLNCITDSFVILMWLHGNTKFDSFQRVFIALSPMGEILKWPISMSNFVRNASYFDIRIYVIHFGFKILEIGRRKPELLSSLEKSIIWEFINYEPSALVSPRPHIYISPFSN